MFHCLCRKRLQDKEKQIQELQHRQTALKIETTDRANYYQEVSNAWQPLDVVTCSVFAASGSE